MNKWKEQRARFTDEGFERAARDPQAFDLLLNHLVKMRRFNSFIIAAQGVLSMFLPFACSLIRPQLLADVDLDDLMAMSSMIDISFILLLVIQLIALLVVLTGYLSLDTRIKFLKMLRAMRKNSD